MDGYTIQGILKFTDTMKLVNTIFSVIFVLMIITFFVLLVKEKLMGIIYMFFAFIVMMIVVIIVPEIMPKCISLKQYELVDFRILESNLHIKTNKSNIDKEINMQEYKLKKLDKQLIFKSKENNEKDFVISLMNSEEVNSVYEKLEQFFEDYN